MIATDSTIICSPLQRTARRLLLAACCILLMGVMGAAADRTIDREHNSATPAVSVAPTPMLAAATAPIAAASTHSAVDFDALADSAAPAAAVETVAAPRTILLEVTAYCPCKLCCGPQAQGITASGKLVSYNNGRFVAADTSVLPFGTQLIIPGYADEKAVEVIDRGGAIKGNKLDVYFDDHYVALQWGRQWIEVTVAD